MITHPRLWATLSGIASFIVTSFVLVILYQTAVDRKPYTFESKSLTMDVEGGHRLIHSVVTIGSDGDQMVSIQRYLENERGDIIVLQSVTKRMPTPPKTEIGRAHV